MENESLNKASEELVSDIKHIEKEMEDLLAQISKEQLNFKEKLKLGLVDKSEKSIHNINLKSLKQKIKSRQGRLTRLRKFLRSRKGIDKYIIDRVRKNGW